MTDNKRQQFFHHIIIGSNCLQNFLLNPNSLTFQLPNLVLRNYQVQPQLKDIAERGSSAQFCGMACQVGFALSLLG